MNTERETNSQWTELSGRDVLKLMGGRIILRFVSILRSVTIRRIVPVLLLIIAAALLVLLSATAAPAQETAQETASETSGGTPRVEVVFVLDTTGSMSGLIEGAKRKIWSIANQIVSGKPTPEVHIGLVGYRDIGDEYVTKVYPLTDDLDLVYENLMAFRADGGGDTPEHVNRALHDAVDTIHWSRDATTLKLIFLVGDCPPHMDYGDGYDYRKICKAAVAQDIIVNTVQCGDYVETVSFWQDIARRGEGRYAQIAQEGGMIAIETPYDEELAELNVQLEETVVPYGSEDAIAAQMEKNDKMREMAPEAAAGRAEFMSKSKRESTIDLVNDVIENDLDITDVDNEDLPEEMQSMSDREKEEYVQQKKEQRDRIAEDIKKLSEKRDDYIAEALKDMGEEDGFDEVVNRTIQEQAASKGISY
jgi:Mg-chelatase subunit ChlD